jgi:hypothetical protein
MKVARSERRHFGCRRRRIDDTACLAIGNEVLNGAPLTGHRTSSAHAADPPLVDFARQTIANWSATREVIADEIERGTVVQKLAHVIKATREARNGYAVRMTVTVTLDLPLDADAESPDELVQRLRLLWALDEVRQGRLTRVRAAHLLGRGLDDFLRLEQAARPPCERPPSLHRWCASSSCHNRIQARLPR